MECELNGLKIKYDDGKVWKWRELKSKPSEWWELKGTIDKESYRCVVINYKQYKYHRVVYFIHNQEWNIHNSCVDNSIDHIDRNQLNNSIENLRVVTNQENQWNKKDAKGYYLDKWGKYHAQICVNCKKKYLGYFENEDDARNAYLEAKAEYHLF